MGITTDTYDREGEILRRDNITGITREKVEEVLASFQGVIKQTPLSLPNGLVSSSDYCRIYNSNGDFIAILRFVSDLSLWRPLKVFAC